jgi:hypothetical protein
MIAASSRAEFSLKRLSFFPGPALSAAAKAGVPLFILDLIGRDFISQIIDELPSLLLPPVMATLRDRYMKEGAVWIEHNVLALQSYFTILKQMYGFEGGDSLEKPLYHLVVP